MAQSYRHNDSRCRYVTIIHQNADGSYEVRSYFIVAESAAAKARQRALEQALKDSEVAQKHADKISGFVKEGFQN